jgi:hypothetical protein
MAGLLDDPRPRTGNAWPGCQGGGSKLVPEECLAKIQRHPFAIIASDS